MTAETAGPVPPSAIIDAHAHLWNRHRTPQPWIDPEAMQPIDRDFAVADLAAMQDACGIDGAVLVQSAHSIAETAELLGLIDGARVRGVVGWVDLAGDVAATVGSLGGRGAGLVGIRHLAHQDPDDEALLRPERAPGITTLGDLGLALDLVLRPEQLGQAVRLAESHATTLVLDHLGNPPFGSDAWADWARDLTALAGHQHVLAKVSGLGPLDPTACTADGLRPAVDLALEAFGPDRLLFGTDWPVVWLRGDAPQWAGAAQTLLDGLSSTDRAAVMGGNASRVYRLAEVRPVADS
ncbi:amidohydrolase family protein [Ruania halotolerans]|uniref:amidohydrolase family protein n=1 Tax=Ruania halotolerans TaxID=2897773 RepID=UPI001E5FFA53|nr:amidohydrolase family protein [Ruania halotolerans]UFU06882.1 amidohydrolase family protein [Ruania halotolerans]